MSAPEFHGFQGQPKQNCGAGEVKGHFCQRVATFAARGSLTKTGFMLLNGVLTALPPLSLFFYLVMKNLEEL